MNRTHIRRPGTAAALMAMFLLPSVAAFSQTSNEETETPQQRDVRMQWWREARFGMFIHWGIYSVPAGTYHGQPIDGIGEWIMNRASIPVAEYAAYAGQFNPTQFDPDLWVSLAKQAGMKYMVITSKHHDGFAMFDSKVTDFDIMDASPFKRDVIRELSEAARKQGLRFGVYYSQAQDWHHPGGWKRRTGGRSTDEWDPAQLGSYDQYLQTIAIPQVRELLTNYGPLDVLWWDTPYGTTPQQAKPLHDLLALQPNIVTNNRLGGGFKGDSETPEQYVPPTGYPGRDWETCMTMNDTWGYKSFDDHYKSTTDLVRHLIDIASKGGNYLLNVGPTAQGIIPQPQVERLQQIGQWLSRNGDAIYATTASPFPHYSFDGRATVKGDTLYIHIFNWPSDGVTVKGLSTPVASATFLADGTPATISSSADEDGIPLLTIMPPANPDPIATVVALQLAGPLDVQPYVVYQLPGADGTFSLRGDTATLVGDTIRYERSRHADNIGYWTQAKDYVQWPLQVPSAGRFNVKVTYACTNGSAGSEFAVAVGDSQVTGAVTATGDWQKYRSDDLGPLDLPAGRCTLTVKALQMPHGAVMNLQQVDLVRE